MVTLANSLANRGFDIDLVLGELRGPYIDQVSKDIRIINLNSSRTILSALPLTRYLRREKPKFMISALSHVNIISFVASKLSRQKLKLVMTEHNNFTRANQSLGLKGAILRTAIKWVYPHCRCIVSVSTGVANDFIENMGIPRELFHTIHNPIVGESIRKKSEETPEQLTYIRRPILISVGRLTRQKDYSTLLYALHALKQYCDASLVILGSGPLKGELEVLASSLGLSDSVYFAGFQSNPYAWMKAANVMVMSSAWEGFGNVLVEAMACGTPVVSTDCPSGPAEILEGGRWGRLVPIGNSDALAKAILDTLNDTNPPNVRIRACDFEVDNILEKYLEIMGLNNVKNNAELYSTET